MSDDRYERMEFYGIPLTKDEAACMIDLGFNMATAPDHVLWCAIELMSEGARSRVHRMSADQIRWTMDNDMSNVTVSRGEVTE